MSGFGSGSFFSPPENERLHTRRITRDPNQSSIGHEPVEPEYTPVRGHVSDVFAHHDNLVIHQGAGFGALSPERPATSRGGMRDHNVSQISMAPVQDTDPASSPGSERFAGRSFFGEDAPEAPRSPTSAEVTAARRFASQVGFGPVEDPSTAAPIDPNAPQTDFQRNRTRHTTSNVGFAGPEDAVPASPGGPGGFGGGPRGSNLGVCDGSFSSPGAEALVPGVAASPARFAGAGQRLVFEESIEDYQQHLAEQRAAEEQSKAEQRSRAAGFGGFIAFDAAAPAAAGAGASGSPRQTASTGSAFGGQLDHMPAGAGPTDDPATAGRSFSSLAAPVPESPQRRRAPVSSAQTHNHSSLLLADGDPAYEHVHRPGRRSAADVLAEESAPVAEDPVTPAPAAATAAATITTTTATTAPVERGFGTSFW
ncbi:hypothetical protein H696_01972 [Fonticula alba]|uniref:Uncharacterized protein n=1 Tax=Fonticula alba TaxID=691883 RepID=A0A058ZAR0_FONAL|nr:hypothetical protein H696_01972 [Fonticula alba]KCV71026.1 hypothetical protein H696_01972 [Fonticula alba]|eukprot:XP_009494149.1 hypothetical protein H696_01972 [Fonticula alba]